MTAKEIIDIYISFFEKRGHKRIQNASLVPQNDPTTLFTSSGMQPLVPYLLGETHPLGTRLVNVQNSFRAQDIDEVGDNRHTTFFRMLGNWSLGDPASPAGGQGGYFKEQQIPWVFEFLVDELKLDSTKLFVTIFKGFDKIPKDTESQRIWQSQFNTVLGDFVKTGHEITVNEDPENGTKETDRIFYYGIEKNWWSRSGKPDKMPIGEPGGPDSEVFFDFGKDLKLHEKSQFKEKPCHPNCDCGRFMEIGNSVFMEYVKAEDGFFKPLAKQNVDFGGGVERILAASQNQQDVFKTNLFYPIIQTIEKYTEKEYPSYARHMRIITDHFISAMFIAANGVVPNNKAQGYVLRRLIRRGFDHLNELKATEVTPILKAVVEQYKDTDPQLPDKFEQVKLLILQEGQTYSRTLDSAKKLIEKEIKKVGVKTGDEVKGEVVEIPSDIAFKSLSSFGLSPTQLKSLGYSFDEQALAEKIKEHQSVSRIGVEKKFHGGLADTQEKTIMGHTATHLMHQALRDVLGNHVHQTGSNITTERIRFDFNFDRKLTDEELKSVEDIVNGKIRENLKVHFEMIPTKQAKDMGAIGLFEDTYAQVSKIYFIGGSSKEQDKVYSIEFCGGPHVDFTDKLKRFKIIKQENIGNDQRRLYATVG